MIKIKELPVIWSSAYFVYHGRHQTHGAYRSMLATLFIPSYKCVTFGVYIGFGGLIDGYSALCVVYEVSLEVVMTTRA